MVKNKGLISRFGLSTVAAGVSAGLLGAGGSVQPMQAALIDGGKGPQLLIGRDDDRVDNVAIQAGAVADQSLKRADVIQGGPGNDVIFGLNGDDVIDGGPGVDIILGGPDGGPAPGGPPNSDIIFGGPGNDVVLWAPGGRQRGIQWRTGQRCIHLWCDGSGRTSRFSTGVRLPLLRQGGTWISPGHPDGERERSHQLLHDRKQPVARLRVPSWVPNAAGAILITERVSGVEQVFCSQGGGIVFADLTVASPEFVPVTQQNVESLNPLVAAMIR